MTNNNRLGSNNNNNSDNSNKRPKKNFAGADKWNILRVGHEWFYAYNFVYVPKKINQFEMP